MRARLLLTTVASLVAVAAAATPALADHGGPGGWVDVDEDGSQVDVGASDGSESPGDAGGESSQCTKTWLSPSEVDAVWGSLGSGSDVEVIAPGDGLVDPQDFGWYRLTCPDGAGGESSVLVPIPLSDPVDPIDLRDEAMDTLTLPLPTVAMNPAGEQVVHVETWLWIDDVIWRTHSRSVSAGGVTATVSASPQQVVWDLGNGDTVACSGPGTPYDPSVPAEDQRTDCSYTYENTSAGQPGDAYRATATIEWAVSWSVTGAAGGGALPALLTSAPVSVPVSEMQALNQ